MATYVNNLRLKEIATGAESGTWGTSTNTNLELIQNINEYANSLVQNKNYSVKTLPFDDYMGSFNVYEQYISDHMPVLLSIY